MVIRCRFSLPVYNSAIVTVHGIIEQKPNIPKFPLLNISLKTKRAGGRPRECLR